MKKKKNVISSGLVAFIAVAIILIIWSLGILIGYGLDTIVNKTYIDKIDEKTRDIILLIIAVVISVGVAIPITSIFTNLVSKYFDRISQSLYKISEGDFDCKLHYKSNNEYLRELINNFNTMIDKLNSVSIMRTDFISSFSHEFKTPMVSIKGYAELLRDSGKLDEDEVEYANIIIKETNRLLNLAEKSMLLSKINSEVIVADKKIFSLNGQIEECIIILDQQFKEKNINVDVDIKRVKIVSDRYLTKQIWINLLNNAIKYTENNGKIFLSLVEENGNAIVKVTDNGCGMSEETLKNIYKKFFRAEKSKTTGGLGLGLTLCKSIVDIIGGQIECESKLGEGTTFTVTLPTGIVSIKETK